jgi:hypothetical protein
MVLYPLHHLECSEHGETNLALMSTILICFLVHFRKHVYWYVRVSRIRSVWLLNISNRCGRRELFLHLPATPESSPQPRRNARLQKGLGTIRSDQHGLPRQEQNCSLPRSTSCPFAFGMSVTYNGSHLIETHWRLRSPNLPGRIPVPCPICKLYGHG